MRKFGKILFWISLAGVSAGCVGMSYYVRNSAEGEVSLQASSAREEAHRIQEQVVLYSERLVPAGLPFHLLLQGLGIDSETAARLAASAQSVFDLRHLRAGNRLDVGRSVLGELRSVRYRIDGDRVLSIAPQGNEVHSEIQTIPSEMQTIGVMGEVHGSLFEAVINAGEKPELAMRLAQIFGWDLDFYTDPRPGDTFRVVVEKKLLSNGELLSYGRILAAEYKNAGRAYGAVLFHDASGAPAYFTPEGKSMKKAFLAFAAQIRCGDHFAFQRASLSSHLERIPPASWNRLCSAHRHSGADNRRRTRDFRRSERRCGKSGPNPAHQWVHHLLHAFVAGVGSPGAARATRPKHWTGGHDRLGYRASSGLSNSAPGTILELRAAAVAAVRSGGQARLE